MNHDYEPHDYGADFSIDISIFAIYNLVEVKTTKGSGQSKPICLVKVLAFFYNFRDFHDLQAWDFQLHPPKIGHDKKGNYFLFNF